MEDANFTIFLVDDDRAVLKALGRLLRSAGYATKSYFSAENFLSQDDGVLPGCVLLDLAIPGLNGLAVQEALARSGIKRPVIFLTGTASIQDSVLAMRAGAVDFLTKPVDSTALLSAIKSAEARDKVQRHVRAERDVVLQRIARLTAREKAVLDHVVQGLLNKQIGAALGIGEKTVKVYRGRLYEKMGVKTVPDLVRMTALVSREVSGSQSDN